MHLLCSNVGTYSVCSILNQTYVSLCLWITLWLHRMSFLKLIWFWSADIWRYSSQNCKERVIAWSDELNIKLGTITSIESEQKQTLFRVSGEITDGIVPHTTNILWSLSIHLNFIDKPERWETLPRILGAAYHTKLRSFCHWMTVNLM
jgi:hypothetical protein